MTDPRQLNSTIPPGWKSQRAKFHFLNTRRVGFRAEEPLSASQKYGVVPQVVLEAERDARVMEAFKSQENFKLVEPDDFVISLRSFQGGIEHSSFRGIISPAYTVMKPSGQVHPGYFRHALKEPGFIGRLNAVITGIRDGKTIKYEEFGELDVPLPPLPVQQAIAAFLDRKTAAIDALIEKKQKLLDLLAEKRAALINQAVTKGLDPNVPMKDSGIPWIGEIPAHWEVKRLKHVSPEITVGIVITPSKYYVEAGVPALRSLNVRENGLSADELVYISTESNQLLHKSMVHAGDLVAVRTGQPGTTAVVDDAFHGANCIDLIVIRKSTAACSAFLCHYMNSGTARVQYASGSTGAIQQHFNIATAMDLLVCTPPVPEQEAIAAWLASRLADLAGAADRLSRSVERLQEYRQSLITAAVTGQLDIGEEAA